MEPDLRWYFFRPNGSRISEHAEVLITKETTVMGMRRLAEQKHLIFLSKGPTQGSKRDKVRRSRQPSRHVGSSGNRKFC